MSAFDRLRAQIRGKNHVYNMNKSTNPIHHQYENQTIILPNKPKKRKMMEVQQEAEDSLKRIPSNNPMKQKDEKDEIDDEEMKEDEGDEDKKPAKSPWGPSDILSHLDDENVVMNIDRIIHSVKQKNKEVEPKDGSSDKKKKEEIVWDHGKTKEGKDSDNNFYLWLEAYAANECKRVANMENMIFD